MKIKKLISILLCALIIISLIPAAAFSEDDSSDDDIIEVFSLADNDPKEEQSDIEEKLTDEEFASDENDDISINGELAADDENPLIEEESEQEDETEIHALYPWDDMTDEEFAEYVNNGENTDYLYDLLNGVYNEAYNSFMARLERITDSELYAAITEKLSEIGAELPDDELDDDSEEETDDIVKEVPVIESAANHADYMIVQWTKVPDAIDYTLAYRIDKEAWTYVSVPLTSVNSKGTPRWDLKNAIEGKTYTFMVYANFADGTTTCSERVAQIRLITPELTVRSFSDYMHLSWEPVTGCSRYKIYYREKGTSTWNLYAWVQDYVHEVKIKDSIIASQGLPEIATKKTYEFAVLSAISVPGITSGFPPKPVTAVKAVKVPAVKANPEITAVTNHDGYLLLKWTEVPYAVNYLVGYREGKNPWNYITVAADTQQAVFDNLTECGVYSFIVYAEFFDGSRTQSAIAGQMRLISPKTTAEARKEVLKVQWETVPKASFYHVYYRINGGGWILYSKVKSTVTALDIKISDVNEGDITEDIEFEFAILPSLSSERIIAGFPDSPVSVIIKAPITNVIVSPDGEITSILEGVQYAYENNIYNVTVRPGKYDIIAEYEARYGEDYFSSYAAGAAYNGNKNGNFDYGLWLNNINLVFESGAVVYAEYTGGNWWVTRYFSAFAVGSHATVSGLVVYAKNLRYAIHPDFHPDAFHEKLVFINCVFSNDSPGRQHIAFGCGLGIHTDMTLENCRFLSPSYAGENISCLIHNNSNNGASSVVTLKNCSFEGAGYLRIAHHGPSTTVTPVYLINCSWTNEPVLNYSLDSDTVANMEIVINPL